MSYLEEVVNILRSQSVFEIYLPFLLTFSIFYAAIRKMNIFGRGENDKTANKISIVIALVAAVYVTIFTPVGITISQFFSKFFAISSIWMVTIVVFMMMFGLFLFLDPKSMKEQFMKKIQTIVIITVALTGLTWLLSGGLGLFSNLPIPINREDVILVLLLVGTGLIIFFVAKDDDDSGKKSKGGGTTVNVGGGGG